MGKMRSFVGNNSILVILFLVSTTFFLVQHHTSLSWDFSSYVLNAKCFFYHGMYCETQRSPLASFLLAPFVFLGSFGEYLYIVLISLLFLYASVRSADVLFEKKRVLSSDLQLYRLIFYFFSISTFTLLLGLKEGTELLTLSLLELALVQILIQKNAGLYLGLAFLARYSSLIFIPFLLIHPKIKGMLKNLGSFALIIFPWFLWNFIRYGNWFTGFIDGYAQNIALRQVITPVTLKDILAVTGYFTLPVLIGIGIACYSIATMKRSSLKENMPTFLVVLFLLILLWNYSTIPTKFPRYLFNLTLPIAFFSMLAVITLLRHIRFYVSGMKILILTLFVMSVIAAGTTLAKETKYALPFEEAAKDIRALGLEDCEILSPHWVPVTYYTGNVYPLRDSAVSQAIEQNKTILIFHQETTPDDSFTAEDLKQLPILKQTSGYILYAKPDIQSFCSKKYLYNQPYVSDHCHIIAQKLTQFLQNPSYSLCSAINLQP